MKILVAVDGSPHTKRMLAYIAAHDEWLGGTHEYTVVHAVTAVPSRAAAVVERAVLAGYYEDEAERVFKPIRAFFKKQGLVASFIYKVGQAAEVVANMARAGKYDLLMMGTHGHGALGNLVMGSVATKVLAHCEVPVLLVR
jgi:nucleotide-binding universal stress UspA family protein